MKKILVLVVVLTTATAAHAKLILNINEATNTISISGDNTTSPPVAAYLFVEGSGSIAGGNMIYPGSLATYDDLEAVAANLWMNPADALVAFKDFLGKPDLADLSLITLADGAIPMAPLQGTLVEGIELTVTGPVVLTLVSDDFVTVFDTKSVSTPEPISIALLGLGGLLLLRRR